MKNLLLLPFLLLSFPLIAQVRTAHVHVNPVEIKGQTMYLFSVQHTDYETFRTKLITEWGKPVKNTVGNMIWKMKTVAGVGDKLTILLCDGVFTNTEKVG